MLKLYPLMIITLIVVITGPIAVDWIAGLTLDAAARTVDMMP